MELEGIPVVVVGLARSGIAAASFLARRGARVVATDRKPEEDHPQEVLSRLGQEGVTLELGGHRAETFRRARTVVVSPGVPASLPELEEARAAGAEVIGELELAFRHLQGRVAAVTGTKGKSTTTAALGAMLRETGRDVRVGGNIGDPAIGMVEGSTDGTLFVLEVSSFQLETTDAFHPHVAVFLNLSADHLDRHASFQEYAEAKARIFRRQTAEDWAIVNADDPHVLALSSRTKARRLRFRAEGHGPADALFTDGHAVLRREGADEPLFARGDVRLPGPHLAVDLLAAAAAARVLGAGEAEIRRAVQGYTGVEHVLEPVAEVAGVRFFNDSKATNVDAARHSLDAFTTPVLAILGGRYKGGDFGDLAAPLRARGKAVLAIGEATEKVEAALGGVVPVVRCASMAEAVAQGFARAEPGDTVLLAPACASFDMFRDYAERGRAFKAAVHALAARVLGRSPSGELR